MGWPHLGIGSQDVRRDPDCFFSVKNLNCNAGAAENPEYLVNLLLSRSVLGFDRAISCL
jgi:hypothetical protein